MHIYNWNHTIQSFLLHPNPRFFRDFVVKYDPDIFVCVFYHLSSQCKEVAVELHVGHDLRQIFIIIHIFIELQEHAVSTQHIWHLLLNDTEHTHSRRTVTICVKQMEIHCSRDKLCMCVIHVLAGSKDVLHQLHVIKHQREPEGFWVTV